MPTPRDQSRRLLQFARQMRAAPTDAEAKMWAILRSRRLAGFKFRRQYPVGGYILDFFCLQRRLAVELDGGQHVDPHEMAKDQLRTERLNELGIRVLRFGDPDVLKTPAVVAEEIYRALNAGWPSPWPSPGVPGEGEEACHVD